MAENPVEDAIVNLDDEHGTFEVEIPEAPPEPLKFGASLSLQTRDPLAGFKAPTLMQLSLTPPKMPIQLIFETPDAGFVADLAIKLAETAARMNENPLNAKYLNNHENIDAEEFDTELRAAVAASQAGSANNPDDASSEKGN